MALESLVADPTAFELSAGQARGRLHAAEPDRSQRELRDRPRRRCCCFRCALETRFFGDDLKIRVYPGPAPARRPRAAADRAGGGARRRLLGAAARRGARRRARRPGPRAAAAARGLGGARDAAHRGEERRAGVPRRSTRAGTTSPATAALMPDRWCAIGFVGNTRRSWPGGSEIPTPLHCSPDLADLVAFEGGDEALPVDDAMAWMVDYERALGVGHGHHGRRVRRGHRRRRADAVRGGRSRASSTTRPLCSRCSRPITTRDGLDVMAQGTPTNNTDEAIAGWSRGVDDVAALFERELDDDGLAGRHALGGGPAGYRARPRRSTPCCGGCPARCRTRTRRWRR